MTIDGGSALAALAAGLLAGLGLAMPMGAVSVLLLRLGIVGGLRAGIPAAAGVAAIDAVYCVVAVALGALVAPALSALGALPTIMAGLVVMGMGARIAVVEVRAMASARARESPTAPKPAPPSPARGMSTFATFAGITAANPLTLVYFAALTTTSPDAGASVLTTVAFVSGVAAASFALQLGLAGCGALVGAMLHRRAMTLITLTAAALVIGLGAALLVSALLSR